MNYNKYIDKIMMAFLRREEEKEVKEAKRYKVPEPDDTDFFPTVTKSWEELVNKYQPSPWIDGIGFEHDFMTLFNAPQGFPFKRIYCNTDVASDLDFIFEDVLRLGLEKEFKTFDGCFNIRKIRGSKTKYSLHAYGLAVDFNAATNRMGTAGDMHPDVVDIFTACGWRWGGYFKRRDPMHFQRAWNC